MSAKYIIRLDDAYSTIKSFNRLKLEDIFDIYDIKPIMAVIPINKDPALNFDKPNLNF